MAHRLPNSPFRFDPHWPDPHHDDDHDDDDDDAIAELVIRATPDLPDDFEQRQTTMREVQPGDWVFHRHQWRIVVASEHRRLTRRVLLYESTGHTAHRCVCRDVDALTVTLHLDVHANDGDTIDGAADEQLLVRIAPRLPVTHLVDLADLDEHGEITTSIANIRPRTR